MPEGSGEGIPLLRRTGPRDRYFDYCLEPYRPRRPTAGKLRSETLLLKCLELAGLLERAAPIIEGLRAGLGRDMVVWGAKHDGAGLFFELYIYDPRHQEPRARVGGLAATLSPHLRLPPPPRSEASVMMTSFDLTASILEAGEVPELNLYLTGSDAHEGRSYLCRGEDIELANLYRFLSPKPEVELLLGLLRSSLFIDYSAPGALAEALPPELFACKKVCVAKKRRRDGIYFSGIDIEQLLWFLRRHAYPPELIEFTSVHAADFDHLYFDVGVDLEQRSNGDLVFPKTSFYGIF